MAFDGDHDVLEDS